MNTSKSIIYNFFFFNILTLFSLTPLIAKPVLKKAIDLSNCEKHIYSQNGEDGVIHKIFQVIGTTNKYFVEFGVESGIECNTRVLREQKQWKGLMMDGFHENLSINLHREFITAENINSLFEKHLVPKEFDLLSIDIDFNDFYIWYALDQYNPRVVIIEYTATHLPNEDKVIIYDPLGMWDYTNYCGASILALKRLGDLKGYALVYADNRGVNLFFIRNDLLKKTSFINSGNVEKLYKFPKYGNGPNGGHTQDLLYRSFISSAEAMNLADRLKNSP